PLVSPVGAGWSANVYAFVGFAPVGLVDPWGLSPMTAGEFREYASAGAGSARGGWGLGAMALGLGPWGLFGAMGRQSSSILPGAGFDIGDIFSQASSILRLGQNALTGLSKTVQEWAQAATQWTNSALQKAEVLAPVVWQQMKHQVSASWESFKDNWQYWVAGATAAVGVVLLFTPLAPLGAAMLLTMTATGVIDVGMQAYEADWDFSQVDYKRTSLNTSIAGLATPVGFGAAGIVASRGVGMVGQSVVMNSSIGGASNAMTYMTDSSISNKSLGGLLGHTGSGVVSGGLQGGVASKMQLGLNARFGGNVQPGQRAVHLPVTAAVSEFSGGYAGGGLNYVGQEMSNGTSLNDMDPLKLHNEALKGGLQSGLASYSPSHYSPVRSVPVMEGVNLGTHTEGSVVSPSSFNAHVITNGDVRLSPVKGQKIYTLGGELNGVKGEYRVVTEDVGGVESVRRQNFVPEK
ncbi:hypothetical protein, partial [Rothia nasimurium]